MTDIERLRRRLVAVGAEVAAPFVELILATAGPLLSEQERLADLDLGDLEPFCPARRLPDDAGE